MQQNKIKISRQKYLKHFIMFIYLFKFKNDEILLLVILHKFSIKINFYTSVSDKVISFYDLKKHFLKEFK